MSKQAKTLVKICRKPPPSDITWEALSALLRSLGYQQLKTGKSGGSRRKFYNGERDALICCHEPHPQPQVDKGCIVNVVDHLKAYGFLEGEEEI